MVRKKQTLKKQESTDQTKDWSEDFKRNNSAVNSAEQQGFNFKENTDVVVSKDASSTKKGLSSNLVKISSDQVQILRKCQVESSADELMKILNRTHKTRFKNDILNPLLACDFFERTIPEKPKSPKQKYRLTNKFVRANIESL